MKVHSSPATVIGATVLMALVFCHPATGQQRPPRPAAPAAQRPSAPAAVSRPNLSGRWTLNRSLSQFPTDVGFGLDLGNIAAEGGGGRGNAAGGGVFFRESEEEARRRDALVEQVRNPSPHLIVAQTDTQVTLTDDRSRSLTFHPDGREETQALDDIPITTVARWINGRLEVRYKVEQDREIRYTFGRTMDPAQLTIEVQLIERGAKAGIIRVYQPSKPGEVMAQKAAALAPPPGEKPPPPNAAPPGGLVDSGLLKQPPAGTPPLAGGPPGLPGGGSPAVPGSAGAPPVPRGPDPELRGLTTVGVVVEDLSSQATACGLNQSAIEAAVAKSLTDAGIKVARNADEDTYVYVQVITTSGSNLCVSRYDVSLFTHATTTLSYQAAPMLARVSLLQKGGLAGGATAGHGDAVTRTIKQYADEVAARIRDANK